MSRISGFQRRKQRVRTRIAAEAGARPRLSILRTNKHIYAQLIDDVKRATVASVSTSEKELRTKLKKRSDINAAKEIGKLIAERGLKAGVKEVVFDRGGYLFHGRVKALADAAREGGLTF